MIQYALIGDGPTDRALLPIIGWALRRAYPRGTFGSPTFLARNARPLVDIITDARAYRPNLIFVHRDAEREPREQRQSEVPRAPDLVPVIPVRMTEAWLLISETGIRIAAGNPNGTIPLAIPAHRRLESLPDPKAALKTLLADASELGKRRRAKFDRAEAVQRLAEVIEDYSPLCALPAFRAFYSCLLLGLGSAGVSQENFGSWVMPSGGYLVISFREK